MPNNQWSNPPVGEPVVFGGTATATAPTPRQYRILVTGGRHRTDRAAIKDALADALKANPCRFGVIVHGAAAGADTLAAEFADAAMLPAEAHPADWKTHGKAAGPIRNQAMVDLGADICLAFPDPDSVGTWDCIRKATAAGIPVRIYPPRGAA